MVDNIQFDEDATRELYRAKCYFDTLGKGDEFLDDLEDQIAIILSIPFAFQIRYNQVRIVRLDDFPYTIHYTINDNDIVILNILNQVQDF